MIISARRLRMEDGLPRDAVDPYLGAAVSIPTMFAVPVNIRHVP
jgi:hypothetical protein